MTPEMISPEFVRVEQGPVEAPAEGPPAKAVVEIRPRERITAITQLPSIWTMEANVEWLIDGILPLGSVNLITSESGVGKTWLAYAIAGAVARGESFAGLKVQQRPVLYLDGENPLCVAKQRLFHLGIPQTPNFWVWGGWIDDPPPGPNSPLIREFAKHEKPLLIWDSLIDFHDGDEQSAKETRAFMKHFRSLANLGATVLILHHTGKTSTSQDYRGSSDIKAAVDMAYHLEPEFSVNEGIHLLTLRNFKGRFAPGKSFGLEFVKQEGFIACEMPDTKTVVDPMQTIIEIVRDRPGSNQSQIVKIAKALGVGKHQVEECLADGPFNLERGNGRTLLYTVAEDRIPELPAPKEREYGNTTVPA
jgi:predicted ATP-dependent serine protease